MLLSLLTDANWQKKEIIMFQVIIEDTNLTNNRLSRTLKNSQKDAYCHKNVRTEQWGIKGCNKNSIPALERTKLWKKAFEGGSCRHLLMLARKNGEEECFSYSQKKQFSDKKMKKVSKDAQGKSCGSIARWTMSLFVNTREEEEMSRVGQ